MAPARDDEAQRRAWFEAYADALSRHPELASPQAAPYRCPCCHHRTLDVRGEYDICPVCFWEDEGQDSHEADNISGANGSLSLTQARENYLRIGACEAAMLRHVRPPRRKEREPPR
jgi:hypothetical protein